MSRKRRASPANRATQVGAGKASTKSALAEMNKLADEAGDWRLHLTFEALVSYHVENAVRALYSEHLDNCPYCQEALETFNSREGA